VRSLTLTAFRNYDRLRLDLSGDPVVLTGPNGAGKTNLLEAVSFLGAGRGLRAARLADIDRCAEGGTPPAPWAVAAVIQGPEGNFRVGTGRDPSSTTARRVVRVDEKPASGPAALARWVPVLWLTPAQDRLFTDRPSARRLFLDKLVAGLDPAHAVRLSEYERAMRERNRLLREGGSDAAWLAALEQTMAAAGTAIAAARRQGVVEFTAAAGAGVGPFPAARIEVAGGVEEWLASGPALAAEEHLVLALAEARGRDAEMGGASVGPHRSDMVVTRPGSDLPASALSTGEQKTLLVSIILGAARRLAAERGFAPVLLLDEIAAHLDLTHRAALFEEIAALGAQAWMTGTDAGDFSGLESHAQHFIVEDGRAAATAP
jgi:DNA replication and repair protein RecF